MPIHTLRRATMFGGIALLAACGDSGTEPNGGNVSSFTATVTGDLQTTFTGVSVFGTSTAADELGFALAMAPEEENEELQLVAIYRETGGVPAGTQHALGNAVDEAEVVPDRLYGLSLISVGTEVYGCASTGGTTTFTTRTADRLAGSYSITMACSTLDGGEQETKQIEVTGTYSAIRGDVAVPDV